MKIDYLSKDVITENIGDVELRSGKARISDKNKNYIFSLLSKIYSDEVGSIVREITSNCFDAHIKANKRDEPVIVRLHIDDSDNYFLEFIDKGTGISPKNLDDIYMSYGESDKRESDEYLGAFGLGSKSPFSYTEYFYLITKVDGTQSTYLLNSTVQGPEYNCLLEEECDLENGTIVRIPIQKSDLKEWSEKIVHQLRYFRNVYVIGFDDFNNNYKIKEYDTFQFREDFIYRDNLLHLVIGDVSYPINFELLKEDIIKFNVALKFNIGELTITPNREEIKYSLETIKLIKDKILAFKQEFKKIAFNNVNMISDDFYETVHKKYNIRKENFKINNLLDSKPIIVKTSHLPFLQIKESDFKININGDRFTLDAKRMIKLFNHHMECSLKYSYSSGILSKRGIYNHFYNLNIFEVKSNLDNKNQRILIDGAKLKRSERAYLNEHNARTVFRISNKHTFYNSLYRSFLKSNIKNLDLSAKVNGKSVYSNFIEKIDRFIYDQLFTTVDSLNIPLKYGLVKREAQRKEQGAILLYEFTYGSYERYEISNEKNYFDENGLYFYSNKANIQQLDHIRYLMNTIGVEGAKFFHSANKYHNRFTKFENIYNVDEIFTLKDKSILFNNNEIKIAINKAIKKDHIYDYYYKNKFNFSRIGRSYKMSNIKNIDVSVVDKFEEIDLKIDAIDKNIPHDKFNDRYINTFYCKDKLNVLRKVVLKDLKDEFKIIKNCQDFYLYFSFFRCFITYDGMSDKESGHKLISEYLHKNRKQIDKFYKQIVK